MPARQDEGVLSRVTWEVISAPSKVLITVTARSRASGAGWPQARSFAATSRCQFAKARAQAACSSGRRPTDSRAVAVTGPWPTCPPTYPTRPGLRPAGRRSAGPPTLTGGVNVPPAGIGQEDSSVFVSGPEDVYAAHRAALDVLAATDYRGADAGYAQLYYQLNMIMFWTAYTGWYQALAVAQANGLTAADIVPYAGYTADTREAAPAA